MTYVAWVGSGGGGTPSGSLIWYSGKHSAQGVMPVVSNPATTARNDFVARLAAGVTCEGWEGNYPGTADPWENGTAITWDDQGTPGSVEITRNGVLADFFGCSNALVVTYPGNGRFNTSAPAPTAAFCEFALYTVTVSPTPPKFQMNFSPPIAAWGAYLTDLGDFFGASVHIEIFKSGGGSETYLLHSGSATDGNLDFIGFVDTTGTTYTSIVISAPGFVGDGEEGTDGIGIDDIYWCAADGIL